MDQLMASHARDTCLSQEQYFLPVRNPAARGALTLQLDDCAAKRLWVDYPLTYAEASKQRHERSKLVAKLPIAPQHRVRHHAARFWRESGLEVAAAAGRVLGVHVRGTDKRVGKRIGADAYSPFIEAWLQYYPRGRAFVATDDAGALDTLVRRFGVHRLRFQPHVNRSACAVSGTSKAMLDCTLANPMSTPLSSARLGSALGDGVLLDTLLLSKVDFLLKPASAVSEFAIYYSSKLRLHKNSYDFELPGQPLPSGAWWTERVRT